MSVNNFCPEWSTTHPTNTQQPPQTDLSPTTPTPHYQLTASHFYPCGLLVCPVWCVGFFGEFSNNMLYPKEDKSHKRLLFACRHCSYSLPAPTALVYSNSLAGATPLSLSINAELTLDPTLQRTKKVTCTKCGNNEAVYFARSDERMELVFVCCNLECAHYWIQGDKDVK